MSAPGPAPTLTDMDKRCRAAIRARVTQLTDEGASNGQLLNAMAHEMGALVARVADPEYVGRLSRDMLRRIEAAARR